MALIRMIYIHLSATTLKPLTGAVNSNVLQGNVWTWHWCGFYLHHPLRPDQTRPPQLQVKDWHMSVLQSFKWTLYTHLDSPTCLLAHRLNMFMWEQRQRAGFRFWIRRMTKKEKGEKKTHTQKDSMKPSALPKLLQRQSGWNKSRRGGTNKVMKARRISKQMTHFFHLRRECLLIKATCNTMLKHESFFFSPFVLPEIVLEIIWHINHVDIFLFPPSRHHSHTLSRGRQFVFQGGLWKRALMPAKRKKGKKK